VTTSRAADRSSERLAAIAVDVEDRRRAPRPEAAVERILG
jgi:hypothetical protein